MSTRPRRPFNLPQLLLRAFYWMDEGLQGNLRRLGGPEISHSQSMMILTIGEGIGRPSAIAERLGISRQAVHQALRILLDAGIIEMAPDPADARAKVARLSDSGRPLHRLAAQILEALELELARRIGAADAGALRAALEKPWGEPAELAVPRAGLRVGEARRKQASKGGESST